jgi:hypothetical protein
MAAEGATPVIAIALTITLVVGAVVLGLFLSKKLFPHPERSPQQAATIRRAKRIFLLYCAGLLVLAGLIWWLSGNLLAGIGITLAVMVALQFIVGGIITHKKAKLNNARSQRAT